MSREAFEAWCKHRWAGDRGALKIATEGRYAGEYEQGNIEFGWQAWQAASENNRWKDAVIDALIVDCIYQKAHEDDPRKAINDMCLWEQQIALDPAVSSEAAKLSRSAPEGYKLVPVEPTQEMQDAGSNEMFGEITLSDHSRRATAYVYRAMLSAAPEAP